MKTRFLTAITLLFTGWLTLPAQNDLWINNPDYTWWRQAGNIKEATLTVRPKGLQMQYSLYLTFSAGHTSFGDNDQLETVLDFTLPEEAVVIDSWLWVGNDIIQGRLIDRWSASEIYEDIVDRKRDPSVLYKQWKGQYQLRVYPMKRNETRKVRITYLMPVSWSGDKIEAAVPTDILSASAIDPDLHVLVWEENGFGIPGFSDPEITFSPLYDKEFGPYLRAMIPAAKLNTRPLLKMTPNVVNNCYVSVYQGETESYYQLSLNPADYIEQEASNRILVVFDYKTGNSTYSKAGVLAMLKEQLLNQYSSADGFNMVYSGLQIEKAFTEWVPLTAENINLAISKVTAASTYSNLPGSLSEGITFIKNTGGMGSIVLVSSSDNFGNFTEANNLIKDLRKLQDPLYPIYIADFQDRNALYYYIGNRYYMGQEYLYVNLSKISTGYYMNIRQETYLPTVFEKVFSSVHGMITAFDMFTAPAEGFCYGRFGQSSSQGFPVNEQVTQIGKFYGSTPFVVYLTGMYKSKPFSKLVQISSEQIAQSDTTLAKMWHGNYISELESASQTNTTAQEILYESLTNRVLSVHSAFLCLEPSDTVAVCKTCKDESRLTGIRDAIPFDSTGCINLYPNPFTDRITIEIDLAGLTGVEYVTVSIFNQAGQLLFEKEESGVTGRRVKLEWNGTGSRGERVPAGNYIVLIQAGPATWSKQIIKSE